MFDPKESIACACARAHRAGIFDRDGNLKDIGPIKGLLATLINIRGKCEIMRGKYGVSEKKIIFRT